VSRSTEAMNVKSAGGRTSGEAARWRKRTKLEVARKPLTWFGVVNLVEKFVIPRVWAAEGGQT
jgi:hypothetical protein